MPINKRNPGQAPTPSRGGPRASNAVDKGIGSMKAATRNRPDQSPNRSNSAYNHGSPEGNRTNIHLEHVAHSEANAPTSTRDAYRSSWAHKHSSLKGIGGSHGGAIDDPTPVKVGGLDSGRATDCHGGGAKAKENIRPNSAHEYSGFGDIGGSTKTSI